MLSRKSHQQLAKVESIEYHTSRMVVIVIQPKLTNSAIIVFVDEIT